VIGDSGSNNMGWLGSAVAGIGGKLFGGSQPETDPRNAQLQSADYLRNQSMQGLMGVQGRQAPQAGYTRVGNVYTGQASQLNGSQQAQWRANQMALANRLQGISTGQQAGAGELAAQRQGARAIGQQMGMARMQRGGNAALAARGAARNAGNIGLATSGQAQQAAMGDQQMANQTLTGLMGQGRQQDIDIAGQNAQLQQGMSMANLSAQNQRVFQQAGLDQSTSLANMQSKLSTMGMNDQAALAYMAQLFNVDLAEMQARLGQEQLRISGESKGMFGDLLQAGGTMGAAYLSRPGQ